MTEGINLGRDLIARRLVTMVRYVTCKIRGKPFLPLGVQMGKSVYIGQDVKFDWSNNGRLIRIDDYATIVSGTKILCHDASCNRRIGATWFAPVRIGKRAYLGANSIILPGVNIGDDAIVGAGAVVADHVSSGMIVGGIPARVIGSTFDLDQKRLIQMKSKRVFDSSEYGHSSLTKERSDELHEVAFSDEGYFISERPVALKGKSREEQAEG